MSIIQRFYNRSFGDYGIMRAHASDAVQDKEWADLGCRYTKADWDAKHRGWIIEPLHLELDL